MTHTALRSGSKFTPSRPAIETTRISVSRFTFWNLNSLFSYYFWLSVSILSNRWKEYAGGTPMIHNYRSRIEILMLFAFRESTCVLSITNTLHGPDIPHRRFTLLCPRRRYISRRSAFSANSRIAAKTRKNNCKTVWLTSIHIASAAGADWLHINQSKIEKLRTTMWLMYIPDRHQIIEPLPSSPVTFDVTFLAKIDCKHRQIWIKPAKSILGIACQIWCPAADEKNWKMKNN